jgi:hypothetical protein
MQFTRLLLCNGKIENVACAIPDGDARAVNTPPVVMTAAPPAPARNPVVLDIPMVVNAAPNPAPITGARRSADR